MLYRGEDDAWARLRVGFCLVVFEWYPQMLAHVRKRGWVDPPDRAGHVYGTNERLWGPTESVALATGT